MYDMHYDLLTILYFHMINHHKKANKEKLYHDLQKIYQNNILGGIINLYFMTPQEMKEELDISIEEMKDIKRMLEESISCLNKLKNQKILPQTLDFIYSIEGCDYIENKKQLEELYSLGLRSILPVWNHENQYGSGFRTENGLSEKGRELIQNALDLGIIIDVSHANEKTFFDIIEVYKKNKKETSNIIASHSNVKTLCDRKRNLTDEQLITLKNVKGYIGLFTNGQFITLDNQNIPYSKRQEAFLNHLDYLIHDIKIDIDKIFISTDDMNFNPDSSYHHLEAYPIEDVSQLLFEQISSKYDQTVANKILVKNAQNLIHKVKKKI